MNLEEELAIEVNPWRGRLITLGVLVGIAAVIGVAVFAFFFRDESETTRATEDLVVGRATINANLIVSGVAEAQLISNLTFRTSGRVGNLAVSVGDEVEEGDILASLESDELDNAIAAAQALLAASQARLALLLEGATDAELAAATQNVVSAEVALDNAQRDLGVLLEGPSQTQLTADEQSVVTAEAALNQANRDRQSLIDGPTPPQIASANQVVISAQAALDQAMRDRQSLIDGATVAQIAQADQNVASAQAGLNLAERSLQNIMDSPTDAQVAAAQQSVAAAEASLASARASLDRLEAGPDDAVIIAAEAQVTAAEQGVASAEVAQDSADANVTVAEAAVLGAGFAYCALNPGDSICPVDVPLSTGEVDDLLDLLSDPGTDPGLITPINTLIQTNSVFLSALNAVDTAELALESAEASLEAAEANLDALTDGPSDQEINAAEAAVTAAEEGLTLAELTLAELLDGVDPEDIASAQDSVVTAQAALASAVTSRADLLDGPDAGDIARVDGAILTARAVLDTAVANQEDLLEGPDDDDFARADDQIRSARAALNAAQARRDDLLDDPESDDVDKSENTELIAEAAVGAARAVLVETERGPRQTQIAQEQANVRSSRLQVEAAQILKRNAQIISPFNGTVAAVNISLGEFAGTAAEPAIVLLTPDAVVFEMNIGETDYPQVQLDQTGVALFDALPGRPYPFRVIEIGLSPVSNQGVVTYPITGAIIVLPDAPRPAPGMSANGQIVTDSKVDVIAVPPRAIRRSGGDQVVDVLRNGEVVEQIVVTGASDNNNVEIVEGLSEGETIVVPALIGGGPADNAPAPTLPSGIR